MKKLLFIAFCFSISFLYAQRPINNSADLLQEIKKLDVIGNVLYLAAHPDDENTRLISYLENERLMRAAYLSLTRGDGGQNLIGTEIGEAMGILRTQELLEARKLDGGEQFFSRAVDFGYSKTDYETFSKWGKDEILADVVWVIRNFKPDVIITRFPPDKRAGHGHHIASSKLAEEAFRLAADENAFPEQLKYVDTWQAKRLLWDVFWWNTKLRDEAISSGKILETNIGSYNEVLGLSYSEIAADGRSKHKSQGFGTERTRGNLTEYLKHTLGEEPKDDIFDGINTSWSRIEGSRKIQKQLHKVIAKYDASQPSAILMELIKLYDLMQPLADNYYVKEKLEDLKKIILASSGIYAEALAEQYSYAPNDSIHGVFKLIVRSTIDFQLKNIQPINKMPELQSFKNNEEIKIPFSLKAPPTISQPYWLWKTYTGLFHVEDQELIGRAENQPLQSFNYTLSFPPSNTEITFSEPLDYKWSTRIDGELHRDVIITPEVTANISQQVYLAKNKEQIQLKAILESHRDKENGKVSLALPHGWKSQPETIDFNFKNKGEKQSIQFTLTPPEESSKGEVQLLINKKEARSLYNIEYPHIKTQTFFPLAKAQLVKMELESTVNKIAYVNGSGDDVAKSLQAVGLKVDKINPYDLPQVDLKQYKTILVGIRAYNINDAMINGNKILMDFVEKGGTVIVQYNTSRGLIADKIGPYPFKISDERVTVEEAWPTILQKEHPLLNTPNKIVDEDFNDWVQERGLYFSNLWDGRYETILKWSDPGEEPQQGSILVTDYGEGKFIYTGISFFRQLPAGVPGAYRLLINMISYGQE